MAKTLLDACNEILKRVGVIAGDAAALTSLTDSARQRAIDVAVQVVNEGIDELYTINNKPLPREQSSSTITLVAGARSYALASDLVTLRFPLIDRTNTQMIDEYPGGYNEILVADPELDDTGLPTAAAIRPTDGYLFMDVEPTSNEAGRVYHYQYDRDLALSSATDTVPFNDATFRAMVPAWVQLWKRELRNEFDAALFAMNVGRASRMATLVQPRSNYCPRR